MQKLSYVFLIWDRQNDEGDSCERAQVLELCSKIFHNLHASPLASQQCVCVKLQWHRTVLLYCAVLYCNLVLRYDSFFELTTVVSQISASFYQTSMGKRRRGPSHTKSPTTKKPRDASPAREVKNVAEELPSPSSQKDDSANDSDEYQFHSILRKRGKNTSTTARRKSSAAKPSKEDIATATLPSPNEPPQVESKASMKNPQGRVHYSSQSEAETFTDDPEALIPMLDDGSILSTWRYPSSNATEIRRGSIEDIDVAVFRIQGTGVALGGCGWIRVLRGNASVLGGRLTPESNSFFVVSAPLAPFAVTVAPVEQKENKNDVSACNERDWLKQLSPKFLSTISKAKLKCKKDECVVLFAEPCETKVLGRQAKYDLPHSCQFYMYRSGLPSCPEGLPAVRGMMLLDKNNKVPCFTLWEDWDRVTQSISHFIKTAGCVSDMRLLICGPSGTGKSVGVRCMLNYLLLSNAEKVVLIDTDVGQPEMNIPGVVAAHVVVRTRPGASVAWNRGVPIAGRFFGNVTPRDDPAFYTRCVKEVINAGRQYSLRVGCPLVVNSDGWVSDTGADLLKMVTREVAPSHVVAFSFPDTVKNDVIAETLGAVRMDCAFELISPLAGRTSSYSGALVRDLSIATYFSYSLTAGCVYEVAMDDVRVHIIGESVRDNPLLYLALNGCVVALGGACGRGNNVNVHGFGIVRGVDSTNAKLYICTPLPEEQLDDCDVLVVSAGVQVPPALFLALADRADFCIKPPYVEANVVATGGQIRSRQNLPRKAAHA